MSDPMNEGTHQNTGNQTRPRRVRKPRAAGAAKPPARKSAKPASATRTRTRRPPLPDAFRALIDNYVETKTTPFFRVNKGALVAAIQKEREARIELAIREVDEKFLATNAGGLLD